MRYRIHFWHGFNKKIAKQLEERCGYYQDQTCLDHVAPETYEWRGTLDLFKEQWGDMFMYIPGHAPSRICITLHSNFNPR